MSSQDPPDSKGPPAPIDPTASEPLSEAAASPNVASSAPEAPSPPAPQALPRGGSKTALDPLIGQTLLDRYEVTQRLGAGGMGAVYIGRQKTVGRPVALKILRSDLTTNEQVRERFRREAEIIGKLRHPNTIQLIDYGETPSGMAVMVMELLVGQPLNDRLRDHGPLPLLDTLNVGIDIASSLAEAHQNGMVHRDLKPANIFLVEVAGQTHAKVLDFGIARILDEEATRLTSTGQVFGTPRYMSPEQALSTGEVDARSDLYSLALILYECIVGQPPFVAQTSIQYLSAHSSKPAPKLRGAFPDAPEALEALIDACLAKSPDDRPPSADAVAAALTAIRRKVEGEASVPIDLTFSRGSGVRSAGPTLASGTTPGSNTRVDTQPPFLGGAAAGSARKHVMLGAGLLAFAAASFLAFVFLSRDVESEIILELDAGLSMAAERDAGSSAIAAATGDSDAGHASEVRAERGDASVPIVATSEPSDRADAGEALEPDAGRAQPGPPRTKTKPKGVGVVAHTGESAVTGPASMTIPVDDEEGESLVALAKSCKSSVLKGRSKLTLKGCPKDCAILIDEKCGGRTPQSELELPNGLHEVGVVCGQRVVLNARHPFPPEETVVLSCR